MGILLKALESQASISEIRTILQDFPDDVKTPALADAGSYPLHDFLDHKAPKELLLMVLENFPEAAVSKRQNGQYPLHIALSNKYVHIDVVKALLKVGASVLEVPYLNRIPIEIGKTSGVDTDVMLALLQAYVDKAELVRNSDATPLIIALELEAPVAVISALVEKLKYILGSKDGSGDYLLHTVLRNKCSLAALKLIVQAYPEAIAMKNNYAEYPLKIALSKQHPPEVIEYLLNLYPSAAKERVETNYGSYFLLHFAIENQNAPEVLSKILRTYPEATHEVNAEGYYSLHLAAKHGIEMSVLREIYEAYPEAIKHLTANGYPLQLALVAKKCTTEIIEYLSQLYPDALKYVNGQGETILHHTLWAACSKDVVAFIIQSDPDTLKTKTSRGKLPLHYGCEYKPDESVLHLVLDSYLPAVFETTEDLELPLHLACLNDCPFSFVHRLVEANPESARSKTKYNIMPFHLALENMKDTRALLEILTAFPGVVREKCDDRTTLCLALSNKTSLEVIQSILREYPEAAMEIADSYTGRYGLHIAVEHGLSADVVEAILNVYPEAARLRDKQNYFPLHVLWADCYDDSPEVVDCLLRAYPEAMKESCRNMSTVELLMSKEGRAGSLPVIFKHCPSLFSTVDAKGYLPLHYALKSVSVSYEVVSTICQYYPEALKRPSVVEQKLPLHFAAEHANFMVIELLLKSYPEAAQVRDHFHKLPLEIACSTFYKRIDNIRYLFEAYPTAIIDNFLGDIASSLKYPTNEEAQECMKLFSAITEFDLINGKNSLSALALLVEPATFKGAGEAERVLEIKRILNSHGDKLDKIYNARDNKGRRIIELAAPDIKKIINSYCLFCGRYELVPQAPLHCSATSCVLLAKDSDGDAFYGEIFDNAIAKYTDENDEEDGRMSAMTWDIFYRVMNELDSTAAQIEAGSVDELYEGALAQYFDKSSNVWVDVKLGEKDRTSGKWTIYSMGDCTSNNNNTNETPKIPGKASRDQLRTIKEANLFQAMSKADTNKDGELSREEFTDYCKKTLGETRPVVLKLMKNKDQYDREIAFRRDNDLDSTFVIGNYASPCQEAVKQSAARTWLGLENLGLTTFKYCLVMPAADKSLDAICRYERPEPGQVKLYAKDIVSSLHHLHSQGLIHGDLKLLNIVRLNRKVRLIDLDAAARSFTENDDETTIFGYAGSKFSSGILPPEMFAKLDEIGCSQYEQYWSQEKLQNSEWWKKIKPRPTGKRNEWIVVKTFAADEDYNPILARNNSSLPYELVPATRGIDYWSVGAMLYTMLTGRTLLLTNRDEDLVDDSLQFTKLLQQQEKIIGNAGKKKPSKSTSSSGVSLYEEAMRWTKTKLAEKILLVENKSARGLLSLLLDPNREAREKHFDCMADILKHPYFMEDGNSDSSNQDTAELQASLQDIKDALQTQQTKLEEIHETTRRIETLSHDIHQRIEKTEQVLLRGMTELQNNGSCPSCILMVNQKLKLQEEEDESSMEQRTTTFMQWMDALSSVTDAITTAMTDTSGSMKQVAGTTLKHLWAKEEKLYLYLIDEVTMQPVIPEDTNEIYPIVIDVHNPRAPALLPLVKISLKALMVANTGAAFARCLGYPLPVLSDEVMEKMVSAVGGLDHKSSLHEYDMLEQLALLENSKIKNANSLQSTSSNDEQEKEDGKKQKLRGKALRELQQLLEENDAKKQFCDMQYIMTADGKCLWTTAEHAEQLDEKGTIVVDCGVGTSDDDELIVVEAVNCPVPLSVDSVDRSRSNTSPVAENFASPATMVIKPTNSGGKVSSKKIVPIATETEEAPRKNDNNSNGSSGGNNKSACVIV